MTRAGNTGPDTAWPEDLLASVSNLPPHSGLYVALSGGLDSVLLLHSVARLAQNNGKLTAIHVNHQIQPNSTDTENFCRRLCQSLDVPCRVIRVNVPTLASDNTARTGGLEEAARTARYQAFMSFLQNDDMLLMAHHADDQSETVLFRLIRGTGVAGLAGIPVSRAVGKGVLYRPFLDFSRRELEDWADAHGIAWVEDPSNRDQRFDRNFLRQSIIPALKQRWPSFNRRLAATARACAENEELASSLASIHFARCRIVEGGLDLPSLAELTVTEQKNLIRWWVSQHQYTPPDPADWSGLLSQFLESGPDRQPEYQGPGYVLRRYQNALVLVAGQITHEAKQTALEPGQETAWNSWRLKLQAVTATEADRPPRLLVHGRKGGERIRIRPNGPSRPLKKWLQDQAVPSWERSRLPLVTSVVGDDEELVAVGDLCVSALYCGESPVSGWRLILGRDSD
jgi:tRNA(Ile)-lysidine synthase